MAKELKALGLSTGVTYRSVIMNPAGLYWTGSGNNFAVDSSITWSAAAVAMSPGASVTNDIVGDFPAAITTPGDYIYVVCALSGGSLTLSDVINNKKATGRVLWSGAAEVTGVSGTWQVANAFLVDSGTLQSGGSTAFTLAATGPSSGDLAGMLLWITGGAGSNQAHLIADYNPATLAGHVDRGFVTLTNNTSQYTVLASDLPGVNSIGQIKATIDPTQVDTQLSATHGAGTWGGLNISLNPNLSTAITLTASADFTVFNDSNWQQTITITGMNSTGWTQMVLTIKADANADADSAALVMARVSNPGIGGDGLLILKGAAAPDPSQGSITVGAITPDTQVTWNLSAAAMDLPASATPPYAWELARWKGAVKDIIAAGKLVVKRSVRRAVAAP